VPPLGPDEAQRVVVDKDVVGQTRTRSVIPVRFSRLETVF
jgi:protein-L-isoaspartate(D-aspartate) O-methyltransferase